MKYDFNTMKKDFLSVKNGDEWNEIRKKYPKMKMSDMDQEMKRHLNQLIRGIATQEQLENPHIHYEVKKKIRYFGRQGILAVFFMEELKCYFQIWYIYRSWKPLRKL